MEPIHMTMAEFISKVAEPRGMLASYVESECARKLELNEDWAIVIGTPSTLYIVKKESIKPYFDAKDANKVRVDEEKLVNDFVFETEPAVQAAKSGGPKK